MDPTVIKLGDLTIQRDQGRPHPGRSAFAARELGGMDIELGLASPRQITQLEAIIAAGTAQIEDPFAGRAYSGSVRQARLSTNDRSALRHYRIEVREEDGPPIYTALEINGQHFTVLSVADWVAEDGLVASVALRLSPQERAALQQLWDLPVVQYRRVGVDADPRDAHISWSRYWSRHQENGEVYYKQKLILIPPPAPATKGGIATASETIALRHSVARLTVRLDYLTGLLVQKGVLDSADRDLLLQESWQDLTTPAAIEEVRQVGREVPDVEELF